MGSNNTIEDAGDDGLNVSVGFRGTTAGLDYAKVEGNIIKRSTLEGIDINESAGPGTIESLVVRNNYIENSSADDLQLNAVTANSTISGNTIITDESTVIVQIKVLDCAVVGSKSISIFDNKIMHSHNPFH